MARVWRRVESIAVVRKAPRRTMVTEAPKEAPKNCVSPRCEGVSYADAVTSGMPLRKETRPLLGVVLQGKDLNTPLAAMRRGKTSNEEGWTKETNNMDKDDDEKRVGINDILCIIPGFYPKSYSFGFINNDNPFSHTVPSLLAYISLMFILSKAIYYSLRPLKQPRFVCDMLAGILMGPSGLGNIKVYSNKLIVVSRNALVLRTLSMFGVMFHLFTMGVKTNPSIVTKGGRKAMVVSVISFVIPLLASSLALQWMLQTENFNQNINPKQLKHLSSIAFTLSSASFPVIADLINELHLLNSELGRMALSSVMMKDLTRFFILVASGVASKVNLAKGEWKEGAYTVLGLFAVIIFLIFVFRPAVLYIANRVPKGGRVPDSYIFIIFLIAIFTSIVTQGVGSSYVVGPVIAGLVLPEGPPLGTALVKHVETFVAEVFLPLFYVAIGQVVDLQLLLNLENKNGEPLVLRMLLVLIIVSWVANIVSTMVPAIYLVKMTPNDAFLLGITYTAKGFIELLLYLRFYNDEAS
ncbi:hypothetical protein J5N97_021239 [Dioscorea zingiberensis]|uniref:Cation/H+ exchanger transmembrane domain-containing protein n=1 Tax=Dioscorea zingiberensis TaxID=325984 RepID=A0A9D5CHV4_9LILI|nr:hypothetical protein J5N97_021239 [Dioscorea zingiberensis]